jgi:peroxiredoxin Q/BCP
VKVASAGAPSGATESAAAAPAGAVSEGSKAPGFELLDQDGQSVRSSELAGAPYVLYFYPKDNTPGCTQEACDFRDQFPAFSRDKIRVYGVSPDSAKSHASFRDKFQLPFPLLVDDDKSLATAYGVWEKKKNYGREYMGIVRSTFLIDGTGVVRKAWRGVRVAGHADAVLAAAREIG